MRRIAATLVALLSCGPAFAEDAEGCSISLTSTDPGGVGTYTAECHWPIAPGHVTAIVGTLGKMAEVTSGLAETTRLPDGRLVNVFSAGWPIDDRQSTIAIQRTWLPDGGLVLTYTLAPEQAPLGEGRVQTRRDDGRWEIRPDGSGGTRLVYANTLDPGGGLPLSLVRRAMPDRMATSLSELRAAAEAGARAERARAGGR